MNQLEDYDSPLYKKRAKRKYLNCSFIGYFAFYQLKDYNCLDL